MKHFNESIVTKKYYQYFRCVKSAYMSIRILNIYCANSTMSVMVFGIAPFCFHQLPYMLWTPFDQTGSFSTYTTMFLFEAMSILVAGAMSIYAAAYILLVLILSKYNYDLLGERAAHIGYQSSNNGQGQQNETYAEMVQLIKLHLKMNR